MPAIYNQIGHNYNHSRKADPYLVSRMYEGLFCGLDKMYLDIGCGTGNYTRALSDLGLEIVGIDPSSVMLDIANQRYPEMKWMEGWAEKLPLEEDSVDAVIGCLTLHHWDSIKDGFEELKRVIKPNGKMLFFTALPSQMESYWLIHYFPKMMRDSNLKMPSWTSIQQSAELAGWHIDYVEKYEIQESLEDYFLYAGKHDPSFYLNEEIRKGISSFSSIATDEEIRKGLASLSNDIDTGYINEVMKKYRSDSGDYLFISFV